MHIFTVLRVLGLFLMLFSISMLPPVVVSEIYHNHVSFAFLTSFCVTAIAGLLLWLPCRKFRSEIKIREGFLIVVLFWLVLSLFGALPFILSHLPGVSWMDSLFESTSGLTTTGVNVFTDLDKMPKAVLFYRQQMQFLGGMGIVVLAIAILPMLGIGGMQLFRAEIPGPIKDEKLTPRIAETAKTLWFIYLGLTLICAFSYWLGGMTGFEAISESFATLSTGGFSVHDRSFGYYNSTRIDLIASFFMFLGGVNFALHYVFLKRGRLRGYWQDAEFRAYVYILLSVILLSIVTLLSYGVYASTYEVSVQSIFTVVSLSSTTGFTSDDFSLWPTFLPYLMMIVALIGGCSGSTSGGLKVMRTLLLQKQAKREMMRLLHPKAILTIKLDQHVLSNEVIQSIWSFVVVFFALFLFLLLLLLSEGLDFTTAFGAVSACLSNVGAGIGKVAHSFDSVSNVGKFALMIAMLAGRLEIFTLLLLFTPAFWQR